jgi:hypothetical protein
MKIIIKKMGGNIVMKHVKSQSKKGTIVIKKCIGNRY